MTFPQENSGISENSEEGTDPLFGHYRLKSQRFEQDLIRMAINQRWPIKDEHKQQVVESCSEILRDEFATNTAKSAAARNLIACERQNQSDEALEKGMKIHHDHTGGIVLYLPEPDTDPHDTGLIKIGHEVVNNCTRCGEISGDDEICQNCRDLLDLIG